MIEIEIKACLNKVNKKDLLNLIDAEGFIKDEEAFSEDIYYNHPDNDFKKSDEALRIRKVKNHNHQESFITYKGPKKNSVSVTRFEAETKIEDPAIMDNILTSLGFKKANPLKKKRLTLNSSPKYKNINICLDKVYGIGDFIEIEKLSPDNTPKKKQEAILNELFTLLKILKVPEENLTTDSYLDILSNFTLF